MGEKMRGEHNEISPSWFIRQEELQLKPAKDKNLATETTLRLLQSDELQGWPGGRGRADRAEEASQDGLQAMGYRWLFPARLWPLIQAPGGNPHGGCNWAGGFGTQLSLSGKPPH